MIPDDDNVHLPRRIASKTKIESPCQSACHHNRALDAGNFALCRTGRMGQCGDLDTDLWSLLAGLRRQKLACKKQPHNRRPDTTLPQPQHWSRAWRSVEAILTAP